MVIIMNIIVLHKNANGKLRNLKTGSPVFLKIMMENIDMGTTQFLAIYLFKEFYFHIL